jgi:hypothetical protein
MEPASDCLSACGPVFVNETRLIRAGPIKTVGL